MKEVEIKPSYYAIIPASVRYDKRLSANAKLLYGEITALANSTGYCYATNRYFAELYDVTNTSISLWVKQLIDAGHINSHIEYREGTKEILNRYLSLAVVPIKEILNTSIEKNLKDNNTSSNNTLNKDSSGLFDSNEIPDLLTTILNYLNEKKPSKIPFKKTASNTSDLKARIKEKYKEEDFKKVIDLKIEQWKDSDKMKKYIRPSTLFGEHFGEYLVETEIQQNNKSNSGSNAFKFEPTQTANFK